MNLEENRKSYLDAAAEVGKLKLVIVGQDPYPNGSNGIAFCKNTFEELFDPYCCGKEVLFSLGYSEEKIRIDFNSPIELFFHLLSNGIAFVNVSSVLLKFADDSSIQKDIEYNTLFLEKALSTVVLGKSKAKQLFVLNYPKHEINEAIIHPSGKAKKNNETEWNNKWAQPYLEKEFLDNFNTKELNMEIEKYFNLSVDNKDLFSAGEVEEGSVHGVQVIDGEHYATLYHIQKFIAKGELKEFLSKFQGAKMLAELSRQIGLEYALKDVKVKYKTQSYEIKKYPYTTVLQYYLNHQEDKQEVLVKSGGRAYSVGLSSVSFKNFKRFEEMSPVNLGRVNLWVGKNNAGKSSVVEGLMLLNDFLQQNILDEIDLDSIDRSGKSGRSFISLLNRSKNKSAIDAVSSFIEIDGSFDNCQFSCSFMGYKKTLSLARFIVSNTYFTLSWSRLNDGLKVKLKINDINTSIDEMDSLARMNDLETEIYRIEQQLENNNIGDKDRIRLVDNKFKLKKNLAAAKSVLRSVMKNKTLISDNELFFTIDKLDEINIQNVLFEINRINSKEIRNSRKEKEDTVALRREFEQRYFGFDDYIKQLLSRIRDTGMYYLEGTSVKSAPVITNNGNEKGLYKSIKYLYDNQVFFGNLSGDNSGQSNKIETFVNNWIGYVDGFGLGESMSVQELNGQAFSITIEDKKGNGNAQYLSDLGLGGQRIVELILGVARVIHEKDKKSQTFEPLVLVEEPEAHLHPALQSKLTEFFYEVNLEYGIRFIVETHSEYIIRKSQLIGIDEGLFATDGQNPFNVIYFDFDKGPYTMKYRKDGVFIQDFGPGFYDVASQQALRVLLSKKRNKNG